VIPEPESLENAIAASWAEMAIQSHPIAEIDSARRSAFLSDALSYVSLRHVHPKSRDLTGEIYLAQRRACSTPWVARVSRLIGNSDTTAKPNAWQVRAVGATFFSNGLCGKRNTKCKKRHSMEWRLGACDRHWPPSQVDSGVCLRRSGCRLPDWLFPFEGRSLAVARAGYPVLLWSALRSFEQADTSLAYITVQSVVRSECCLLSKIYLDGATRFVRILEANKRKFFKKA
jgi:hypothetical protein